MGHFLVSGIKHDALEEDFAVFCALEQKLYSKYVKRTLYNSPMAKIRGKIRKNAFTNIAIDDSLSKKKTKAQINTGKMKKIKLLKLDRDSFLWMGVGLFCNKTR